MTSHRIGVNLRVSGNCDQGGRKYMEDYHAIKFVKKDDRDYEFAYFGIFDGHGGPEASRFARDNLLNEITKYDQFWGDDDEEIKFAIRNGFLDTHTAMWKELDNWPRTVSGLPSTSGTTASIAIVKKGKLYVGHVGDSGIVLGCDEGPRNAIFMKPLCLTKDHKPDNPEEKERIEKCGGAVVAKAGVQRVVWSRPKVNHKGPVRRSTQIDKIPFLAVARSLGDLWSYDYYKGQFVVSPEPDVSVMALEPGKHRSMILGSDGLWNMLTPHEAVSVVTDLEMHFEDRVIHDPMVSVSYWINPAEKLVTRALNKWRAKLMKADNISCIVVLIDPLGPSKLTLLRKRREEHFSRLTQDAKANNNTITKKGATMSSSSSSLSLQGPTTSSATTKANHNQNNLGGRENKCSSGGPADKDAHRSSSTHNKGDSDADAENKSQEEEGEAMTTGHLHHTSPGNSGVGGGGSSNSFVGRDITSTTNQTGVRGGHVLRSATHTSPTASRMPPKAASASKVRSLGRASFHRGQHGASGSSDTRQPLVPRRVTALFPGDLMDDSVQATSALNSLSPMGFNMTLSPTVEDPGCPGSRTPPLGDRGGLNTAALNLMSPVTMSSSLLKLMSLDAVKAQSSPPVPRSQASSSSAPNLRTTDAAGTGGQAAADARDGRRHRRSSQGVPRNFALPPHQQSSFFVSSALLAASSVAERSAPSQPSSLSLTEANKTFHSVLSLKMNRDTSSAHATRSLDKTFHSTRVLRPGTPQRAGSASSGGMVVTTEHHRHQPASSSSHSKAKDRHADSSKSLRGLSVHSSSGGSTRKAKKRLGLLNRTRSTLRRARDAARKALCPENRALFKQLPGAKRKSTEKHNAPGTPSSKRLRRSDGHS